MKKLYFKVLVAMIFIAASGPNIVSGQCTCSSGDPATPATYTTTLDSLTSIIGSVDFPQFDPSIGNLSCIDVNYNITSVLSFSLKNILSSTQISKFDYTQYTGISDGYGLGADYNVVRSYGPYTLGPNGSTTPPLDSVSVGPDTLFNNYH